MNMQLNTQQGGGMSQGPAAPVFLSAKILKARVQAIQEVMEAVMHEGQHYYSLGAAREVKMADGTTLKSPNYALSKSGAEVLCMTFQLAPEINSVFTERDEKTHWKSRRKEWFNGPAGRGFTWVEEEGDTEGFLDVLSTCRIYGPNGNLLASAQGSANNHEAKYRTQNLADVRNTLLKMSQKRSYVAAVLLATGASDLFTQDYLDEDDQPTTTSPQKASGHTASKPATTAGAATGDFGTALSEAQRKACTAASKAAGVDAALADTVIHVLSHAQKSDTRAFMDEVMSRDAARVVAAFTKWTPKEEKVADKAPDATPSDKAAPATDKASQTAAPATTGSAVADPLWDDPPEGR